jgi:hypothetical protein
MLLCRLWKDDAGYVVSAELVTVATVLVVGATAGMVAVRNQVVQEMDDVAGALGSLDQSYSYGGIWIPGAAWTAGSCYCDCHDKDEPVEVGRPHDADDAPSGIEVVQPPWGHEEESNEDSAEPERPIARPGPRLV